MTGDSLPPTRRSPSKKAKAASSTAAILKKIVKDNLAGLDPTDVAAVDDRITILDEHSPDDVDDRVPGVEEPVHSSDDVDDHAPGSKAPAPFVEDAEDVDVPKVSAPSKKRKVSAGAATGSSESKKAKVPKFEPILQLPPASSALLAMYSGAPLGTVGKDFLHGGFNPLNIVELFDSPSRRSHSYRAPVSTVRWINSPRLEHHEYTVTLPFIALRPNLYDIFGLNRFPIAYSDRFLDSLRRRWIAVSETKQARHGVSAVAKVMEVTSPTHYTGVERCHHCAKDNVECYDVGGGCAYCLSFGTQSQCTLNHAAVKEVQAARKRGEEAFFHFAGSIAGTFNDLIQDLGKLGEGVTNRVKIAMHSLDEPLAATARSFGFVLDPDRLKEILRATEDSRTFINAAVQSRSRYTRQLEESIHSGYLPPPAARETPEEEEDDVVIEEP